MLAQNTLEAGTASGMNFVLFGGGVAATLAAHLVHSAFEVTTSNMHICPPPIPALKSEWRE